MSLESITRKNGSDDTIVTIGSSDCTTLVLRETSSSSAYCGQGPNDTGGPVVLYSEIPYLTRVLRIVGHVAVTNSSRTKVYELRAWPYLSTNQSVWILEGLKDITAPILFGRPKKFLPMAVPSGSEREWDDALEECSEKWRRTVHMGQRNNCHSFVSDVLNLFHAKLGGTGTPHTFQSLMWDVKQRGVPIPRIQQPWSWVFDYKKLWLSMVETCIGLHKRIEPQCRRQQNKKNTQVVFPLLGRVAKPMAEVIYGKLQSPTEKKESVRRLQQQQALGFHVPEPQFSPCVSVVCCCIPVPVACIGYNCEHCKKDAQNFDQADIDHTLVTQDISNPVVHVMEAKKIVRFASPAFLAPPTVKYPNSCPNRSRPGLSPTPFSSVHRRNSIHSTCSTALSTIPGVPSVVHQVITTHPECPLHNPRLRTSQPTSPLDTALPNQPYPMTEDANPDVFCPDKFYQQERTKYSIDAPLTPPNYGTLVSTAASTATERACRTGLQYLFSISEHVQHLYKTVLSEPIQSSIQNSVDKMINIVTEEYYDNNKRSS